MQVRLCILALAAGLVLCVGQSASANGIYGGGCGYGYGFGYGIGIGGLYNGLDRYSDYRVPYFAAHPPVYYSRPVPRTYGYSPFAYPPHFSTPEIACESAPLTITNPHVSPSSQTESQQSSDEVATAESTKSGPLVIVNPYATPATYAAAGG